MIAALKPHVSTSPQDNWQERFLELLPKLEASLNISFRGLRGDSRAEAVQEGLVNALVAYRQLWTRGKADLAYPTVLAGYAAKQYFAGRRVAARLNVKDVMSPHCRQQTGVRVERLDRYHSEDGCWSEILVEDKHAGPAEIVPVRLDFADWLAALSPQQRQVANTLATGETTSATARKFQLSRGRISQLRQELRQAWKSFQGDLELV